MLGYATSAALGCARYALLLSCLASCTGSPATMASRPDLEVMTPEGVASVSMRQSPIGMTDVEFCGLVTEGMESAGYLSVDTGQVRPPYPSQRIVWHVTPSGPRPMSRLAVNVFDGGYPYAYEQTTISNDASPAVITSDIASMSQRLFDDIAARANAQEVANRQASQNRPSGAA